MKKPQFPAGNKQQLMLTKHAKELMVPQLELQQLCKAAIYQT